MRPPVLSLAYLHPMSSPWGSGVLGRLCSAPSLGDFLSVSPPTQVPPSFLRKLSKVQTHTATFLSFTSL